MCSQGDHQDRQRTPNVATVRYFVDQPSSRGCEGKKPRLLEICKPPVNVSGVHVRTNATHHPPHHYRQAVHSENLIPYFLPVSYSLYKQIENERVILFFSSFSEAPPMRNTVGLYHRSNCMHSWTICQLWFSSTGFLPRHREFTDISHDAKEILGVSQEVLSVVCAA